MALFTTLHEDGSATSAEGSDLSRLGFQLDSGKRPTVEFSKEVQNEVNGNRGRLRSILETLGYLAAIGAGLAYLGSEIKENTDQAFETTDSYQVVVESGSEAEGLIQKTLRNTASVATTQSVRDETVE